MKRESRVALSVAAAAFTLLIAQFACAQAAPGNDTSSAAMREVKEVVPAIASLTQTIDANTVKEGDQIRATLGEKIKLKDGTELPGGTEIVGQVTVDQVQNDGTFRLALVFTNADLKDGKVIPIKATIMRVYPPVGNHASGDAINYAYASAHYWTDRTTQVDQPDALQGVELQSMFAGSNSGSFVSKQKDEIRLSTGTLLDLAIAPQGKS